MKTKVRTALLALASALVEACATSPTGRTQLMLVSEQQAISASRQAYVGDRQGEAGPRSSRIRGC